MENKTTIENIIDTYNLDFKGEGIKVELGLGKINDELYTYENLILDNKTLHYRRTFTEPEDNYKRNKDSWNQKYEMVMYKK